MKIMGKKRMQSCAVKSIQMKERRRSTCREKHDDDTNVAMVFPQYWYVESFLNSIHHASNNFKAQTARSKLIR